MNRLSPMSYAAAGVLLTLGGCASTPSADKAVATQSYIGNANAYQSESLKEAREQFEFLDKNSPDSAQAALKVGNLAMLEGRPDTAAQYYETALELDPRSVKAHYNLGVAHLVQAENHFSYHTALTPNEQDNEKLLRLLGALERFSGEAQPDDALDALSEKLTGLPQQ